MKTLQECLVLGILFCVINSYPELRCPYPSERGYRSRWFCNGISTEKYACLYNSIQKKLEESCKFEPKISGEGKEYQISVYPDPVSCQNPQRYQPFPLRSNISSECVLLKSTCSDDGQYLFYYGSSTNDHRCGCDFPKGFGFVNKVARQCDCNPSKEDCSCYLKKNTCLEGYKLSSDYSCIPEDDKTHVSKCPGIGPDRKRNDTLSLHPKNKTDDDGARIYKIVATTFTAVCICYVICVFAFLLTNRLPICKCLIKEISAPFNLKACEEGHSLRLSWSYKPADKYPSYQIQEFKMYYTYNDNWNDPQHHMVAADTLHYYFSKLLPSKTYRFKVAACLNNLVEIKCREEETYNTGLPVEPQYFIPYKNNDEDNGNICSFLLKWAAPMNNLIDIDSYLIKYTTDDWETREEKLLPSEILEYEIPNVQKHVHYIFEIVACNNNVCSIPLTRIYSTKHDTYQSGADFDVKAYKDISKNSLIEEIRKVVQDEFNGLPGVQLIQNIMLSKGSIVVEFTFTSEGFDDEKVLHETLENAFKAGVIGPWDITLNRFWFKRLHDPLPPQQVTSSNINAGVLVSWIVPPSTLFNTEKYIVEFSRNNWITKEEINVSVEKKDHFISKVLPSTTIYAKVYTCICHSIRSSPSAEVITNIEGPTPPDKIEITAIEDKLEVSWIAPRHPVLEFVKDYKILMEEGDNMICETVNREKSTFLKQYCQPLTIYKVRVVTCTVNGMESEPSQVVETKTKDFSKTEKENFVQLSRLLMHVAYNVIKEKFDKEYPASDRKKLFEQNKQSLESYLSEDQMKEFLIKTEKGNFENGNFDIHLLLVLFVCFKGWKFTKTQRSKSQTDEDNSEISDLNKIDTCLKHLEETKDNKIPSKEFESLWNDVSQAIVRLGGEKYKPLCESLRVNKILKQENEETYMFEAISQSPSMEINLKEIIQNELEPVKERQNKQEEYMNYFYQTQQSLQSDVEKINHDNASVNVCPDSHQIMIKRWKEDNKRFQESIVVSDIISALSNDNNCVTITGIPGIGKTATLHHVALYLKEIKQYTIVPCFNPNDIRKYYKQDLFQVFVLDDICGKYSVEVTKVDKLLDSEECIKNILIEGKSKVMSSCRLQIFQEPEFKQLDFVTGKVFDMSNKYQHTVQEKLQIAHEYLPSGVIEQIEKNIVTYSCFPLKCKLFEERRQDDPLKFFKNHYDVYTDELDKLEKLPDKSKYCALFLTVVFNGCIDAKTLFEEASDEFTSHAETQVKSICAKFRVDAVSKIETKLESFLNVYLTKNNTTFLVIHDTMLDFLCSYFGRKSQKEFIQFADIRVLQERTLFTSLCQSKLSEKDEFTVDIAEENRVLYFNRLINEMKKGQIQSVFYNSQMKLPNFRQMMIQAFNKRDKSFLQQLFVTKDHDTSSKTYDVNCYTPLSLASYLGYDDIIKFMIPFIDKKYLELFDAIKMSCVAGHAQVFKLLIEKYKEVECTGKKSNDFNFLKLACIKGRQIIVNILIKTGYQVDCTDSNGMTPLMFACLYENIDIINELLKNGSDINRSDINGVTSLRIACDKGNLKIVDTLIRNGANVNISNKRNITPLMASCEKGNLDIFERLLNANADVNKKGQNITSIFDDVINTFLDSLIDMQNVDRSHNDGWTALHFAVILEHKRMIKALIKFGADIDLVNVFGVSPIMLACIKKNIDIISQLVNAKADINIQDKCGRTCLMTACDQQNSTVARFLLSKNPRTETRDILGRTALHIACDRGNCSLVEELIKAGACINSCDLSGNTCINISSFEGNNEILTILIEGGADINKPDKNGWTPLKKACQKGNKTVVELLIERCTVIDQADNEGWTPLMSACKMGHVRIVKLLISKNAKIDYLSKTGFTPLIAASQSNQVEIMNILITSGADVNTEDSCKGLSPLKLASSLGHENAVKTLIEKGANPDIADQQGWTPLKSACKQGHLAVVAFLIMNKANINKPDKDGWTPLKIASLSGHTKIVQLLLENNAKIDQADNAGWTSLMSSCQGGHTNIVLMLIQKGANINHISLDGYTPICIACKYANTNVIRLLISHGANVETADNNGLTPLRIACDQVHVNKVKVLINAGADVNHVDINNISPLNAACKYGEYDIIKSLINGKASINLADNEGNTPLIRACEFGHLNIVQFLVDMDCDVQHANNIGWTPLLVAVKRKYVDIINLLETQGASFGEVDLFVACEKGHIQIVKLLIDKGFDINAEGKDGLCLFMFALKNQQFEIVNYLITMGAELKSTHEKWISLISMFYSDGSTLLTKACSTGYERIARLIIQQTKDFNKRDQNGWSPITSACYGGHKIIVQLLLDNGVYLNEVDGNRQTPFLVALERNQVQIITFLIYMGLDLNVLNEVDDNGCTPLISTCHKNQLPIVEILISKGVDVNAVGSSNTTPLEIAWEAEYWQIVDLLLKNGANVDCSKQFFNNTKDDLDILQFACQNDLRDLLLVLLKDFDINGILKNGDSLLTHSCKHGMIAIVQLLCREGASIDKRDENFRTALELACKWQHIDIIDYLIDNGACVDTLSYEEYTPLITACLMGNYLVVKILIKKREDNNQLEGAESLLSAACSGNHYDVIDLLMDSGIDIKRVEHVLNDLIDRHCKESVDLLALSCKKGLKALTNFLISCSHYSKKSKNESLKYLMYACDSGHESIVSLFISKGLDINQTDEDGLTPLGLACKKGHFKIVESLIRMKIDVNKSNDKGLTPLHFACIVGKENIVLSLIHAAAHINSKDNNGVTPLNLTCKFGHIQIVETLVRNGAAIDICDYKKWTPLMTSCQQGHKKISEFLIKTGVCVDSMDQDGWTALRIACNEGNTDIAEILIENGANMDLPDETGWTPLKAACKRERESVVALLLRKGAKIQECDQETLTPLMLVCQTDNLNILKLFLDQKINVNNATSAGKTALRIACEGGHFEIARILIENGAEVMKGDKEKLTPLHAVCAPSFNKIFNSIHDATWDIVFGCKSVKVNPSNLNLHVAEMLIKCGADVNAATSEGTTPLMLACSGKESELINMLIGKGAIINKVDNKGMSAISISSKDSNYNVVNILLANGSLPDTEDNDGNTPLHFLCGHLLLQSNQCFSVIHSVMLQSGFEAGDNCLETIKLLIDKGANINHSNKEGHTPLFVASMFDSLKRIKLLIENGADISKKDNYGRTVLFAAFFSDNSEILQCLIENGANINDVDEDGLSSLKYFCGVTTKTNESFIRMAKINSVLRMFKLIRTENKENSFDDKLEPKLFLLVENGADVNLADRKGQTPLMAACKTQKNKIVELLIVMGARVDDADNNGITALIIGCFHGYYDIVSMLLEEANVNKCSKGGDAPLHCACMEGHESIVRILLQNNANVNHLNKKGWTPLMFACIHGYRDIVKCLLEHGADATWYSNDRWYPLKLAKRGKFKSLENLLNEYGAYMNEDDD